MGTRRSHYHWAVMKVLTLQQESSDTTLAEGFRCYSIERLRVFSGVGEGRPQFFCGVWLEYHSYYLKIFCLLKLPLFWSSGQREQASFGALFFFLSVFVGISRLPAYQAPSLGFMRKKEIQRIYHYVVPWVLRFPAGLPSAFHLSESSYVCLYVLSKVWCCTQQEKQGKASLLHLPRSGSSSQKEVLLPQLFNEDYLKEQKDYWYRNLEKKYHLAMILSDKYILIITKFKSSLYLF